MSSIKDIANSYAEEYCSDAIYPSHLFKAILHKSVGLVHFLETDLDKDYYYLQEWADIQMQLSPRAPRPQKDLDYSEESKTVMEEAEAYREKFGLAECEPVCVLASLVTPGVGFTFDQLKTLPLTVSEIEAKIGTSVSGTKGKTVPRAKPILRREPAADLSKSTALISSQRPGPGSTLRSSVLKTKFRSFSRFWAVRPSPIC